MLVSLTVGKVDAGVAVLLTEDKRLIEFPSILLPPSISSGSIVDITVARNVPSEVLAQQRFAALQEEIYSTFGQRSPSPPILRLRNATQTSVVLEWDPVELATAEIRSLALYRNGSKAGNIPRPLDTRSTKISGLAVDTEYTFHLVMRTSAGTYPSEKLTVRTHKMTDLSGITVAPGLLPAPLKESLERALDRIGARLSETVRIDTTHFVCTEGRGQQWEKAVEMNIPVVRPEWVEGCEREGRIVGVRGYYLNADPRLRQVGQGVGLQQQQQQQQQQPQSTRQQSSPSINQSPQQSPRPPPIRQQSQQQQPQPSPASSEQLPDVPEKDNKPRAPTANANGTTPRDGGHDTPVSDAESTQDDDDEEEESEPEAPEPKTLGHQAKVLRQESGGEGGSRPAPPVKEFKKATLEDEQGPDGEEFGESFSEVALS